LRLEGSDYGTVDEYAFGAAALAFAEGALRWDADFLDPGRSWRRLDRLHQLEHLLRERVPGQKLPGIDNQKQKPAILHAAARDPRAGEEAQGLDRKGQPIALMSAKGGDTATRRRASVYGGFPSASKATPGGNASPVSAASNTSPHINDAVPMSLTLSRTASGRFGSR
jgi:hypothetical protein